MWIEHIVHALIAVVGRIMAMSFGRKIAEGDPHEVMASAAVREVYLGSDWMTESLAGRSKSSGDAGYGDFQALFGSRLHVDRARPSRSSVPTAPARAPCCGP